MTDEAIRYPTRDEVRAKIFSGEHKPRSVRIEFFGTEIEIRQLRVEDMHLLASGGEVNEKEAIMRILLNMAFVPGTDEKVFEEADHDVLKKYPYGPDMERVAKALQELTNVNLPNASGA